MKKYMAILLLGAACARNPQPEQVTPQQLFEQGQELLERRRWTEAADVFERFTLEFPTHPLVQQARFNIGEAHYGAEEYVTAASEFVRFATQFPNHELADDARARTCDAYEQLSPEPELDQQYTIAAIEHCDALVAAYPNSEHVPAAQETISRLREKLAAKEYMNGQFYLRNRAYDAAVVYFEDLVQLYPDTDHAPRALLRLVEIYTTLGYVEEADAARQRLRTEYPQSSEARQAQAVSAAPDS